MDGHLDRLGGSRIRGARHRHGPGGQRSSRFLYARGGCRELHGPGRGGVRSLLPARQGLVLPAAGDAGRHARRQRLPRPGGGDEQHNGDAGAGAAGGLGPAGQQPRLSPTMACRIPLYESESEVDDRPSHMLRLGASYTAPARARSTRQAGFRHARSRRSAGRARDQAELQRGPGRGASRQRQEQPGPAGAASSATSSNRTATSTTTAITARPATTGG
jgi:hypothetical protein